MSVKWSEQDLKEAQSLSDGIKGDSIRIREEARGYKSASYKLYIALRNLCFISVVATSFLVALGTRHSLIILMVLFLNCVSLCLFVFHEIGDYFEKWRVTVSKEFALERLANSIKTEISNPMTEWSVYSNSTAAERNRILQIKV